MADILKPLYGNVWAEEGEKLSPGNTKIAAGWVQEMMPYQYENFLQNRSDVAISYLLQKGIPEYSIEQEYTANKSVVTYNSQLYMATATVTGVVPTTTASWKRLTISFGVNGAVPISFGGTGATTASEARTNLGVGTSATADFPVANGLIVKLAGNTLAARTISGTSGYITVSSGDGVSGIQLSVLVQMLQKQTQMQLGQHKPRLGCHLVQLLNVESLRVGEFVLIRS